MVGETSVNLSRNCCLRVTALTHLLDGVNITSITNVSMAGFIEFSPQNTAGEGWVELFELQYKVRTILCCATLHSNPNFRFVVRVRLHCHNRALARPSFRRIETGWVDPFQASQSFCSARRARPPWV